MFRRIWLGVVLCGTTLLAAEPPRDTSFGDALLREYFQAETAQITDDCLAEIQTLADWTARKDEYRRRLFSMLGLDPLPERTPLQPVVTGVAEQPEFTVERVHFQSRPGLYVTGNLYVPRVREGKLPAILYVCGHGAVKQNGISFGNKTSYQHHGAWFARNGYVCLTIDTIQLGEIEGLHHGTYREGMWWWLAHGYTPAGVEAWNCIRALDYLQSRPEVDPDRLGVTGRSGGGAYSWWIAALDERIKVAVPVAGITSLQNHVVDGCITGHCDCMYMVNNDRWDFPLVAALVAPRPLLISNTDKDSIFPLDGVYDVYVKTRRIYELHRAGDKLGLQITEGPHKDTQELRIHAFVWFDRFLKQEPRELNGAAEKCFTPAELKVFDQLPADERVTSVHEWFIPLAPAAQPPANTAQWQAVRDRWQTALRQVVLDELPEVPDPCELVAEHVGEGFEAARYQLFADEIFPLDLLVVRPARSPVSKLDLTLLTQAEWEQLVPQLRAGAPELVAALKPDGTDPDGWQRLLRTAEETKTVRAWLAPRGIGNTEWTRDPKQATHIQRRFSLLGKTIDEVRTYDAVQALRALRGLPESTIDLTTTPLTLRGADEAAGWALFATILEPSVQRLELVRPADSLDQSPILHFSRRYLDLPECLALAAESTPLTVILREGGRDVTQFARETATALGWGAERVRVTDAAAPVAATP